MPCSRWEGLNRGADDELDGSKRGVKTGSINHLRKRFGLGLGNKKVKTAESQKREGTRSQNSNLLSKSGGPTGIASTLQKEKTAHNRRKNEKVPK